MKLVVGKNDLQTVNPSLAKEWDYEQNKGTPKDYAANSSYKAWWKSTTGLCWQATICSRNKGAGDPYISGLLPIPGKNDFATLYPDLAKEWDTENNSKSPAEYTAHSGKKVWWKSVCGESWLASINSRTRGSGDPFLCGKQPIRGKNDLATVNPALAAEWDYDKNEKTPQDYTPNSNKKVWWKSSTGYSWKAPIYCRSRGSGDPYLSGKLPIPGKTDLATVNPELAEQWDYERNKKKPEDYTENSSKKGLVEEHL